MALETVGSEEKNLSSSKIDVKSEKRENIIMRICGRHAFVKFHEVLYIKVPVISVGDQRCPHKTDAYENIG